MAPLAVAGLQACGNGFEAYADAFAGQAFAAGAMADIVPHAREMAPLAVGALAAGQGVAARIVVEGGGETLTPALEVMLAD